MKLPWGSPSVMSPDGHHVPRPRTVVLLVLLAFALWLLFEVGRAGLGARQSLQAADDAQRAVSAGQWAALPDAGQRLEHGSDRFASAMSAPPLRALALLPLLGDDVDAVRRAALAVQQTARGASDLLALGDRLDPEQLTRNGQVDLAKVRRIGGPARQAAEGIVNADAILATVDPAGLIGPLRQPMDRLKTTLDDAQPKVSLAGDAFARLPDLLGGNGTRHYLLALQNPAESRPTGGIIGSYGLLTADNGKLVLTETGVNNDLDQLRPPDLSVLDPTTRALYGPDQALSPNFNLSPDFRQAATLFARQWVANGHPPVDGVLSVDPTVLQAILRVTGSVKVSGGPALTGSNAAQVLMDTAYRQLGGNTPARNAYLEASTSSVFTQLLKPSTDVHRVLLDLAEPSTRRHIMAWSRLADENTLFADAGISGRLPAPTATSIGVYTTNVDASKLDYFLHTQVTVSEPCDGGGPTVRLTLRNRAPADVPEYSANKLPDTAPTDHTMNVAFYLPAQRGLERLTVNGKGRPLQAGVEQGWSVARVAVTVPRGKSVQVTAELTGAYLPVRTVLTQPAAHDTEVTTATCPA